MSNDEFYIGYLKSAPPGIARFRLVTSALVIAAALAAVAVVAAFQAKLPAGRFEFGVTKTFDGVLYESPIPMLRTVDAAGPRNFLLVAQGKFGLPSYARGHDGREVRMRGSLIDKDGMGMIELAGPEGFVVLGEPSIAKMRRPNETGGRIALTGELADSKCYLGVMRPATGKVHRACAVRCLSGGIPPALLVHTGPDQIVAVMLAGTGAEPLEYNVEWAARIVRATGQLEWHEGLPIIRVESLTLAGD